MGGTKKLLMIKVIKEIRAFCLANQIALAAEYLPGTLNTRADKAFRKMENSSSEWITDIGFRTIGCEPVCIEVVPPDPKAHKLATRCICMNGGCISNKLATSKSIRFSTFGSNGVSVSQSNEG